MPAHVIDALGREVGTPRPPRRIVSLVPSETETVVALAGIERLVGRTAWCQEPAGRIEIVPTVGGTKKLDVEAVLALSPDLVLANQEENGRRDVETLIARGVTVHVSFPRSVRDALAYLESLATLLHLGEPAAVPAIAELRSMLEEASPQDGDRVAVFAPIWRDPWMTFDARTYGSDLLRFAGARNVFEERARRYPLAADLGDAAPLPADEVGDRDTRYPRVSALEIRDRAPSLILLPDEPYHFDAADEAALVALGTGAPLVHVSGKDLFWYGVRTAGAIARMRSVIDRVRAGRTR